MARGAQLLALRRGAVLPALDHPTLVLHGRHDRSVPVGVIDELRAALGSAWIEAHVLERSAHVITMDVERERVGALVVDFLDRVEAAG
jgi:esterase/lipase